MAPSSKKPKALWQVIHRILNPNPRRIKLDPQTLNDHFLSTVQRTLGQSKSKSNTELFDYIKSLPSDKNGFSLRPVTHNEVLKKLRALRNDTSTGPDNLPTRFIRHCADILSSPSTSELNFHIWNANSQSFARAKSEAKMGAHGRKFWTSVSVLFAVLYVSSSPLHDFNL